MPAAVTTAYPFIPSVTLSQIPSICLSVCPYVLYLSPSISLASICIFLTPSRFHLIAPSSSGTCCNLVSPFFFNPVSSTGDTTKSLLRSRCLFVTLSACLARSNVAHLLSTKPRILVSWKFVFFLFVNAFAPSLYLGLCLYRAPYLHLRGFRLEISQ